MSSKAKEDKVRNQNHSSIGIVYLGLLTVLAICFFRKKKKVRQEELPLLTTTKIPENQIIEKLNNIQKEQRRSSALTNSALGFAIATYMASNIVYQPETHMKIIGAILGFLGLVWFLINGTIWMQLRK